MAKNQKFSSPWKKRIRQNEFPQQEPEIKTVNSPEHSTVSESNPVLKDIAISKNAKSKNIAVSNLEEKKLTELPPVNVVPEVEESSKKHRKFKVPRILRSKKVCLLLKPYLHSELKRIAKDNQLSINDAVEKALIEYWHIEQQEP